MTRSSPSNVRCPAQTQLQPFNEDGLSSDSDLCSNTNLKLLGIRSRSLGRPLKSLLPYQLQMFLIIENLGDLNLFPRCRKKISCRFDKARLPYTETPEMQKERLAECDQVRKQ